MKILLILFFLVSCASSKDVKGPNGEMQKLITCSSLSKCYEKAAEECHGQFETIKTDTKEIIGPRNNYTEQVELLVKCNNHD